MATEGEHKDAPSTRDAQYADEVVIGKLTRVIKLQRTKYTHTHTETNEYK